MLTDENISLDAAYAADHRPRPGSLVSTTASGLCFMVGAGVLTLPYAIHKGSICGAAVMLAVSTAICAFGVYCLVNVCENFQVFTFRDLLIRAFPGVTPSKVASALEILVSATLFCTLLIYFKVIAQSMPPLIQEVRGGASDDAWESPVLWVLGTCVVFTIATIARTLRELFVVSVLGVLAVLYVGLVVVVEFFKASTHHAASSDVRLCNIDGGALPAFTIITGAFFYQVNVPALYEELADRTPRRMLVATAMTFVAASVFYAAVGFTGYLLFGARVADAAAGGNVMANFPSDNVPMTVGRGLMFAHLACAIPMIMLVARRSLVVGIAGSSEPLSMLKVRVGVGAPLVVVAAGVSLVAPGIGAVASYSSIPAALLGFVAPAFIYCSTFGSVSRPAIQPTTSADTYVAVVDTGGNAAAIDASESTTALKSNKLQKFPPKRIAAGLTCVFGVIQLIASFVTTTVELSSG